ncbi:MAG: hypothetical protein V3W41_06230 [Planctomycetota bacterium]
MVRKKVRLTMLPKTLYLMTILTLVLTATILTLAFPATASAQGWGSGRYARGPQRRTPANPKERQERDGTRKSLISSFKALRPEGEKGDKAERNFRRMAWQVARFASIDELRQLAKGSGAERVRKVVSHWESAHARMREHYIRKLDPKTQAQLKGLKGQALEKRLAQARADHLLDKAIQNAKRHEIISLEEAANAEAGSSKEKVRFARELNRRVFLQAYGDVIGEKESERLRALGTDEFWHDKAVRKFRLSSVLSKSEIDSLRRLDRNRRREFLVALRIGAKTNTLQGFAVLNEKSLSIVSKLGRRDRHRLARDLERIHFRDRGRYGLRKDMRERLNPQEMEALRQMNRKDRRAFLEKKFPDEDWGAQEKRHASARALRKKLGADWRKFIHLTWKGKPEDIRAELIKRLGPKEGAKALETFREMAAHGMRHRGGRKGGGRGPGPGFRQKMQEFEAKLSASDRATYDKLSRPERMKYLRNKFSQQFQRRPKPQ